MLLQLSIPDKRFATNTMAVSREHLLRFGIMVLSIGYAFGDGSGAANIRRMLERIEGDRSMKYMAPGEYDSSANDVTVSITLLNIIELNTEQHFGEITFWFTKSYRDPRLTWTGEPSRMYLPVDLIWTPEFDMYDALDEVETITSQTGWNDRNGNVMRHLAVKAKVPCQPKAGMSQMECRFTIGSWRYDQSIFDMYDKYGTVYLGYQISNPEWAFGSSAVNHTVETYDNSVNQYPTLDYSITFNRRQPCALH